MLAFITKSFLGRSTRKNLQNFLPVSGTYWLIKNFYPGMKKKQTKENFSVTKKFISNDNLHLCIRDGRVFL